jgi:hypothetical protein
MRHRASKNSPYYVQQKSTNDDLPEVDAQIKKQDRYGQELARSSRKRLTPTLKLCQHSTK